MVRAVPDLAMEALEEEVRQLKIRKRELLEACKLLLDAWDLPDNTKAQRETRAHAWKTARAALATAEGREPPATRSKNGT